jgi:hypothetical protein
MTGGSIDRSGEEWRSIVTSERAWMWSGQWWGLGGVVEASRFPEEVENWRWKNLVPNVPGVNQRSKLAGFLSKRDAKATPD